MSQRIQNWTKGIIVLVAILSLFSIDYSGMAGFSFSSLKAMIEGFIFPDWAFVYDGSSEDLVHLVFVTLCIAFYGTVLGALIAVPFALLAAHSLWPFLPIIPIVTRFILNLLRSIPAIIYAILFVTIVGPGPFAGALALAVQLIGMLGKLMSEAIDTVDPLPVQALTASGASHLQTLQYAILPQVIPLWTSYIFNHMEINVRSATVLGLVGAGGIGAPVIFALQARNWSRVGIILLAVIIIVLTIDALSTQIRKRLI